MGAIRTSARQSFRAFETDGVPASGVHEPVKSEIIETFGVVEDEVADVQAIALAGLAGGKTSLEDLEEDLDWPEDTLFKVAGDADPENDGVYRKSGASGAGSWAPFDDPVLVAATEALDARDEAQAAAAAAAADASTGKELASRVSIFPDPWFQWAQSAADMAAGHRLYSLRAPFSNRTWEADYAHPYGVGAWKFNSGSTALMGFDIWWDMAPEVGIEAGDVVSVCAIVVASSGSVRMWNRFFDSISAPGEYTYNGSETSSGSATAMDGTPKLLKIENRTVPAGSVGIVSYLDDSTASDFRVIAFWYVKGATAGDRPPVRENGIATAEKAVAATAAEYGETLDAAAWAVGYGAVYDPADITDVVSVTDTPSVGSNSDGTINGWGDILAPAGVTFNAIRIGGELRQPAGATACERLFVVIRKGASGAADDAGATVVADGYVDVDPNDFPLTDVVIPLREPSADGMSGALLTLSDTELDLAEYGVMVYGRTAAGANAGISEPKGTLTNRVSPNRSYLITSANPRTGAWSARSGNTGMALEHVLIDPIEDGYKPSAEFLKALETSSPLQARVDRALTSYGTPDKHVWGEWRLRSLRVGLRRLKRGDSASLDIALIGDSWSTLPGYWIEAVTNDLIEEYGDGGPGWIGLGYSSSGSGFFSGNARPDLYSVARSGTWAGNYRNSPSTTNSPDLSNATSSSAGAKYTITAAGASAVLSTMTLVWNGTADGVVRYRWDGGSWTSLNVQGSGTQSADLGSLPASADWVLEIEVVSGSVDLFGLIGKKATGLRVHKLGSSGSRAEHWVQPNATQWQAGIEIIAPDMWNVMLGTNESVGNTTPTTFGSNMETLVERLIAAVPLADRQITMPPENGETTTYTMPEYVAAVLPVAGENDCCMANLQHVFGLEYADYGASTGRNWMVNTSHPRTDGAAPVIDDFMLRLWTGA